MGHKKHDLIYLKEDRKNEPKEYFKFIVDRSRQHLASVESPRILDIGCATGDFLYYLSGLYRNAKLAGLDVNESMLEIAKAKIKNVEYVCGDINSGTNLPSGKFDAVFMSGVNYIFEDYRPYLTNIVNLMKESGRAYIFGFFNPEKVDILAKVKRCGENYWEPGWNIFSLKTIGDFLDTLSIKYQFIEWQINIDIAKNENDPLRSWTISKSSSERIIVNGAQLINTFYLIILQKMPSSIRQK